MLEGMGISIGVLGFDGVNALDLTGPLEVFAAIRTGGTAAYRVHVTSISGGPFVAESGVILMPTPSPEPKTFDTIVIPGGAGLRHPETLAKASQWILHHATSARRVVSICTGAFGLATTGLMDGRPVATHWRFADELQRENPSLEVRGEALFLKDGHFYTSAGITAGLDLTLLLVEEDFGPTAAAEAAKELVMFLRRPGNQSQICDALVVQSRAYDRLADLVAWMAANPRAPQTLGELARVAGMSPRHFSRRFQARFGMTPARFRENLRLDEAKRRLESSDCNIDQLAAQIGFASDDAFSRAFHRRFRMRPSEFRRRGVEPLSPPAEQELVS